ncbi:hypothetical protein HZB60_01075 [candidate division KSB1 bacterium]|nr:hypothetical protein [candidate division KSB1 bacterium]
MKIQDIRSTLRGIDTRPEPEPAKTAHHRAPEAPGTSIHGDVIDLSAAAQLAAGAPDVYADNASAATLSPERTAEIRAQIQSGFYSSTSTLAQAAAKLREFYRV